VCLLLERSLFQFGGFYDLDFEESRVAAFTFPKCIVGRDPQIVLNTFGRHASAFNGYKIPLSAKKLR
jgi:hypothetical protein